MNAGGLSDGGIRAEELNDGFGQDGLETLPEVQIEAEEREEQAGEHHSPRNLSQDYRHVPKEQGSEAALRPRPAPESKSGRHIRLIGFDLQMQYDGQVATERLVPMVSAVGIEPTT